MNAALQKLEARVPLGATNMEEALKGALAAFGEEEEQIGGRVVVLFTDGESHLGEVTSVVEEFARWVAERSRSADSRPSPLGL